MKVFKISGLILAMGLVGACGGGEPEALPDDVAAVIEQNCQSCHGDPTQNDAPMSIVNCEDAQSVLPNDDSMLVWEAMEARVNDAQNPMPPAANGGPLSGAPLDTLNTWFAEGAPCKGM